MDIGASRVNKLASESDTAIILIDNSNKNSE